MASLYLYQNCLELDIKLEHSQYLYIGNEAAGQNGAFSIAIENPDRDYFTFGTSLTSAFNYGITDFLAYDMLIGYNNVNS